jgi:hypothetical protein
VTGVIDLHKSGSGTVTKTISFTYDAFDRMISKYVVTGSSGAQTRYVWDGDNIVLQFDPTNESYWGQDDQPHAQTVHTLLWGPAVDMLMAQTDDTYYFEGVFGSTYGNDPGTYWGALGGHWWMLADHKTPSATSLAAVTSPTTPSGTWSRRPAPRRSIA